MSAYITIEAMTLRHVDAVLAIEQASSLHPWTHGIFTDELGHGDTRTYRVALGDGVVVGFAGVLNQVGEAHITNVAVVDKWRRQGIASRLLAAVLRVAIDRGARAATLEVRVGNVSAQKMYHRFGFVPAGVRPKYYQNSEDALIMWADDIAEPAYLERLNSIYPSEVVS
jgi:[ribosomal protein S18]-alanine N-acetyltransferase